MGDVLKYRLPGSESINKNGYFTQLSSFSGFSGFIVSNFDKSKRYGFIEDDSNAEFNYSRLKPTCYSKEEYLSKGKNLVERLQSNEIHKAILSRVAVASFDSSPIELYNSLCASYPDAFVYLISSDLFGTWIAATPEILLEQKNNRASTMALAGTRKVDSDADWTGKEREEQEFVSDFILSILMSNESRTIEIDGPKTIDVGPVKHIRTDFYFDLEISQQVELTEKLHPTPAVCGSPREKAFNLIQELETHDRSLYAGIVGDLGNESNLFVNLRCAQIIEDECYLYLGGGYTAQSSPEDEWIETENKAKTLLNIIEKL